MIISAIVAVSKNNAIGKDNDLPWHLPADLTFFKTTTKGYHIILGRKNFDSIGKPLPGRTNIVITRQDSFYHSGTVVVKSITEALDFCVKANQKEVFIIGGSMIYEQTQNLWNKLYITRIDTVVEDATVFFPEIDFSKWKLSWQEDHLMDEKNKYNYQFNLYERPLK